MNAVANEIPAIRLDVGCGSKKKDGYVGIDSIAFDGVDHVLNAGTDRLPYDDGSVEEIHTSHFIEHLTAMERIHFVNEAYRVLGVGGKLVIIVPHWGAARAYGDMTHQWPPVSEFWFYYLDKGWRAANAPHNDAAHNPKGYSCDFAATWGYSMHPTLFNRNQEYQQHAMQFWKEAIQDIHATCVKR